MPGYGATCSGCKNMREVYSENGLFPCDDKRSNHKNVLASDSACGYYKYAGRSTREQRELESFSKDRQKRYIMTAISKQIGVLPQMDAVFDFLYYDYMEENGYQDKIAMYKQIGPTLGEMILNTNDIAFVEYLRDVYLCDMVSLYDEGKYDDAVWRYFDSMINEICKHFNYSPKKDGQSRILESK